LEFYNRKKLVRDSSQGMAMQICGGGTVESRTVGGVGGSDGGVMDSEGFGGFSLKC
jgi:hypothetical protein